MTYQFLNLIQNWILAGQNIGKIKILDKSQILGKL